jgi:hypothetical protein
LGSANSREKDADEFFRTWAAQEHLSLSGMPLVVRWEIGGGGRPHCHFLLSGFSPDRVKPWMAFVAMRKWYASHGLARIRPFRAPLRGAAAGYLTKGIDQGSERNDHNANDWELSRFALADRVVMNEAVWRRLQSLTGLYFDVAPHT